MLLRGCLDGAHTTRVPVAQRCVGLMPPQPHRSLHLRNMMLHLENRQWRERSNPVSATECWPKEDIMKTDEDGAGVGSATWGAPRTNFP